jgi:glycopeptide antibiotics resistance protein
MRKYFPAPDAQDYLFAAFLVLIKIIGVGTIDEHGWASIIASIFVCYLIGAILRTLFPSAPEDSKPAG